MKDLLVARWFLCAAALIATASSVGSAEIAGRANRPKVFTGTAKMGNEECRFTISIDTVTFGANSVANKYKLVQIDIENRSTKQLTLSSDKDRFEALINSKTVTAVLSLQRVDSAVWDSFDPTLRKSLAYPVTVSAASAGPGVVPGLGPEYLSMYVFLPADRVTETPKEFHYTIASLGLTITIGAPPSNGRGATGA